MNDLVHFRHIQSGLIPFDTAHVAVKRHGRKIVRITAAEKFVNSLLNAVFPDRGESQLSQSATLVGFSDVQVIQTNREILISAVVIRAERKITHTAIAVQKYIIVFSRLCDPLRIMICIGLLIVILPHMLRIYAGIGFLPDNSPGFGNLDCIQSGCFLQFNHGAFREW